MLQIWDTGNNPCILNSSQDQNDWCLNQIHCSLLNLIPVTAQLDQPLLVGTVVDWNLSIDLLLSVEKIRINITVAIICSNVQNLTHACVIFLPHFPCCFKRYFVAYLTSVVRTKILGKYDLFSLFLPWLRTNLLF